MAERGVAVLFISHNMQHVLQRRPTGSSCSVRARRSATCATAGTDAREIVTLITGSDLVVEGQDLAV